MKKCLLAFVGVCGIVGCASKPADPLESFKQMITDAQQTAESTPATVQHSDGEWQKVKFAIQNLTYDVTKTDSLASPYSGIVTFVAEPWRTESRKSKAEAEADNAFGDPPSDDASSLFKERYKIEYAYQDGRWVMTSFDVSPTVVIVSAVVMTPKPIIALLRSRFTP